MLNFVKMIKLRIFVIEIHYKIMSENSKYKDWGKVTISKKLFPQDVIEGNWKPKSTVNHTPEFVEFINSMLDGNFHQKSLYMPFEIYKAQAFMWLEENTDPYKTDNPEEVIMEEMRRIDENTLYFAEKYAFIKEGSEDSGLLKYKSKEHNALLYYLIDCGYCILCGKPRQIFATTTIGIFLVKRLITRYNYYMKFVTVSDEKGTEILNDKFKFPFQHLPDWMKPKVVGDSINAFHLGEKIGKGNYGYPNSKCEKVAPSPTAINGGAPQMTLIDEIGEVPDLIDILFETRPTLYVDKHQNGDLQLVRQIIAWGTGVSSNTGKRAFQQFWQSTVELWKQKEYKAGVFIPLFFSWHCRCTPEIYEGEYKAYMMGNSKNTAGINSEGDRSVIFNMHYPSRPIDMFGMSNNRLVPKSIVEDNLKKIRNLPEDKRPVYGYFEPVYDYNAPLENAYTPFKITDARFVPCEDDDPNVSTCIVKRPDYGWRNRYYQGTDPVLNDVGKSFMASTIWDKCIKTKDKDGDETTTQAPIAFVYHRRAYDPKESYLQCMLLGLYYDTNNPSNKKKGVPEVLENNMGISYRDFKEAYGFGQSLVMNNEIFDMDLQGGGAKWGLNTSGHGMNRRKSKVVARLKELIYAYAQNIFYETFFKELDTYVMVQKTESIVYKPIDSKIYRDDCLDATTFAYICAKSFDHKRAYEETTENERVVVSYQYGRDENYNLVLKPVKKRVIN